MTNGTGLTIGGNEFEKRQMLKTLETEVPTKGRKYKGVYPTLTSGKWYAYIMYEGKGQRLGTYETQEEAYEAFCKRARELHGKFLAI